MLHCHQIVKQNFEIGRTKPLTEAHIDLLAQRHADDELQLKQHLQNTMQKLNILVADDEQNHRHAAELLLKEHNLTIVKSYDEAASALSVRPDYEKVDAVRFEAMEKAGLSRDFNPYPGGKDQGASVAEKETYARICAEAHRKTAKRPNIDVVLVDLMMPASSRVQGSEGRVFAGTQMPLGTFLILLALNAGIKNIGLVTDTNHHNHPASAALDPICTSVIKVGDTAVFATNSCSMRYFDAQTGELVADEYLWTPEGEAKYPKEDRDENHKYGRKGMFIGKGWDVILGNLLKGYCER